MGIFLKGGILLNGLKPNPIDVTSLYDFILMIFNFHCQLYSSFIMHYSILYIRSELIYYFAILSPIGTTLIVARSFNCGFIKIDEPFKSRGDGPYKRQNL